MVYFLSASVILRRRLDNHSSAFMPFNSRVYAHCHGLGGGPQYVGNVATEPMALGSPTGGLSPPQMSSTGTQFLPGFLMGDTTQPKLQTSQAVSYVNSRPMQLSPIHASPTTINGGPKLIQPLSVNLSPQTDRLTKRHNSPPTQSLWSTANPTLRSTQLNGGWDAGSAAAAGGLSAFGVRHSTPSGLESTATVNRMVPAQLRSPPMLSGTPGVRTPAQNARPLTGICSPMATNNLTGALTPDRLADALNNKRNSTQSPTDEECWVTVFGYPTARASFILSQFAQFGTIEKHVITNDGNWMHIKYQNKLQARCAMNRNGRVFGDNIMVGVTPCTNQDVLCDRECGTKACEFDTDRENSFAGFISPIPPRRLQQRIAGDGTPLTDHLELRSNIGLKANRSLLLSPGVASPGEKPAGGCGVSRHTSMRALVGDGRSGHLIRTTSVRQNKDSGLLSKALGYMFGWS
ncbi:hypothetical protein EG68_04156 [Paragonimus skrjabini miyazakii]|uniref:Nucleoporin NUP35 n=1 Tax=Paragonimus skrjabini miyazakii TaxID=59628 RepID=A0A8S9YUF1_9TREM|nr:hypothetical protein EG68_04156 [Paragonimus skrjabini miyazakii]